MLCKYLGWLSGRKLMIRSHFDSMKIKYSNLFTAKQSVYKLHVIPYK